MTVDPIHPSGDVSKIGRNRPAKGIGGAEQKDSVNISENAKELAEVKKFINIIKDTPDIRTHKVEQAKRNLESYLKDGKIDPTVLKEITERIANVI